MVATTKGGRMNRNTHFNYERRSGDYLDGVFVAWTMELAGPDGGHYHFWFPKASPSKLSDLKRKAKQAARRMGDPVSFSYDFLPEDSDGIQEGAT